MGFRPQFADRWGGLMPDERKRLVTAFFAKLSIPGNDKLFAGAASLQQLERLKRLVG